MLTEEPRIVKSHDIRIDTDYVNWIAEVKHRYRSAQVKAAVKVNAEKLLFNWQLGRDLVQKKAEERWGAGVVEQVSLDLKREFPDAEGFSTSNLWYMKKWYLFYTNQKSIEKLQRGIGELQSSVNQEYLKLQRPVAELDETSSLYNDEDFPLPFAWLLVCSDMDKIDVQWSFRGINTPMGVATYNNIRIKDALPSQEQLAERVRLLQKELKEAKRLMNKV